MRVIELNKSDIIKILPVKILHYPMTWSTRGVFGYIGMCMDGTLSLVTDTSEVIMIKTHQGNYLISIENSAVLCDTY